jgi:Big-like domain-containing protein
MVILMAGTLGCASDILLPDPPGGGDVALLKVDGDNQTGTVGEQLANPIVVQVLSAREQPVRGRQVEFVVSSDPAAGLVDPQLAVTDASGHAIARWQLGTAPGPHSITARLAEGGDETQFTAAAKAGTPDTLTAQSPLGQPGRRGQPAGTPPVVRVVDKYGNAVPDIPVAWQVTAGEGVVSAPMTQTGADGIATVAWTLGNRIGVHKLTAAIGQVTGSPTTFTATILF